MDIIRSEIQPRDQVGMVEFYRSNKISVWIVPSSTLQQLGASALLLKYTRDILIGLGQSLLSLFVAASLDRCNNDTAGCHDDPSPDSSNCPVVFCYGEKNQGAAQMNDFLEIGRDACSISAR
jgi:hypothetical protein